jgi:hypothetical protein
MWFKRRQNNNISIQSPAASRVEIEVHKNANQEAREKAQEANAHLTDLLVENGFTLKIFLAAGGKNPHETRGRQ